MDSARPKIPLRTCVARVGLPLVVLLASCSPAEWHPHDSDLLFMSNHEGDAEIHVLAAGSSQPLNLTRNEASDNWPVWSPDGSRIAFQSRRSGNLDIWCMGADGTGLVQLTDHAEPDYLPAWSADGASIYFTSWRTEIEGEERAPHVYRMLADGSDERRLIATSLQTSAGVDASADGDWLVYSRKSGEDGADLYVCDREGLQERRITHDGESGVYNGSPTFSPDGQWIAFYSDDRTRSALDLVQVDGTGRRTLRGEGQNWYPRWSPDGRWLVYTAQVGEGEGSSIDVFALAVDGSAPPLLLVGGEDRAQEASWRP